MRKALIIEDDRDIAAILARILVGEGFLCNVARDGKTGLARAVEGEYALILLDLMLPHLCGESVLVGIRQARDMPVVVLSAKRSVAEKVAVLRMGADDYITKPFDVREVAARIDAVLRRYGAKESGELSLFSECTPGGLTRARQRMGALIESPVYVGNMTGLANLKTVRQLKGIPDANAPADALKRLGLSEAAGRKVKHYSLGMKQRLGLAEALLGAPELLLLDEPVNGLDPSGIREIRALLLRLNREQGVTMLISSHYLEQLHQLATDFFFLHRGKIIATRSARQLREACSRYIQIIVEDDDVPAAVVALERAAEGIEIAVHPAGELRVDGYQGKTQRLNTILTLANVPVKQIVSVGMSLEEYFVKLTGGDARDESDLR